MRAVFVGASDLSVYTARVLIGRGDEVVIIDADESRIEELSEGLDCGFIHGDGSSPEVLKEAGPDSADMLFCLTDKDQANIIASLVGRSQGFARVVTSVRNPAFEPICEELGLTDVIVPNRTIARYLADMCQGLDVLELSSLIKHDARLFSFTARREDAGKANDLDLPRRARTICLYRDEAFHLVDGDTRIEEGDEVIVLTAAEHVDTLCERWRPHEADEARDV